MLFIEGTRQEAWPQDPPRVPPPLPPPVVWITQGTGERGTGPSAFLEKPGRAKGNLIRNLIHHLSRAEQTAIVRLRAGHWRGMKAHLKRVGVAGADL